MIQFKGSHFTKGIIIMRIRWYVAYPLNYRPIEELLAERGVPVDHATINRWVVKYAPLLEKKFRNIKKAPGRSWKMDETYIKIKGQWTYYELLIRQATLDFMLSPTRDQAAAESFFKKANRDREKLHSAPLPHHRTYGSVYGDSDSYPDVRHFKLGIPSSLR